MQPSSSLVVETDDEDAAAPEAAEVDAAVANKFLGRLLGKSPSTQARTKLGNVTSAADAFLGKIGKKVDRTAKVDVCGAIAGQTHFDGRSSPSLAAATHFEPVAGRISHTASSIGCAAHNSSAWPCRPLCACSPRGRSRRSSVRKRLRC